MSFASRVNAVLARLNMQLVKKTGLDHLRQVEQQGQQLHQLEQQFQTLQGEHRELKARHERLSNRLHLPSTFFDLYPNPASNLPDAALDLLTPQNPRLLELTQRYRTVDHPVMTASMWTEDFVQQEIDLYGFRADGGYVWQHREINTDLHYALCTYYLKTLDTLGLLDRLSEDTLFGAYTVEAAGHPVSRDLLDSIAEIYFLERHLRLSTRANFNLLDIGAGYGRLGHRLAQAVPHIGRVFCTDAIATSSFLCEYYLKFRGVDAVTKMVPFDELQETLTHHPISVAINIHSFSECAISAIAGWLDFLAEFQVPYLMLVPNALDNGGTRLLSCEPDLQRIDYRPLLQSRGYRQIACDPKFLDPAVQANGLSPTHHFLFQRE